MSEISNDQYLIVCANVLCSVARQCWMFLMMEGFSPSKEHPQGLLCTWPCTLKKLDEESQEHARLALENSFALAYVLQFAEAGEMQ
jgi:hypothetical protein